jgi:hypothetical protein
MSKRRAKLRSGFFRAFRDPNGRRERFGRAQFVRAYRTVARSGVLRGSRILPNMLAMNTRARRSAISGVVARGDIMVKWSDGSAVNKIIRFGQMFGRGPSKFTHAGVASGPTTIIEMGGHGLCQNNLLIENAGVKYDVFRCTLPDVPEGAANAADLMFSNFSSASGGGRQNKITYTIGGAARSISKAEDFADQDVANTKIDALLGRGQEFFCSGFTVLCYQMALTQLRVRATVFKLTDVCYQPAFLWKVLGESPHFRKVGTVIATQLVT